MTNILTVTALTGCLLSTAATVEAASWIPSYDPVIADATGEAVLFGGDVFLASYAPVFTASGSATTLAPASVFIEGGPDFAPGYLLTVEDANGNILLEGAGAYASSLPGEIEWGFELTTDETGLFGEYAMAFAAVDPELGDPLGLGIDAVTGAGLVISGVAQVPLPAALPLLATALAGLALARRRAR